MKRGLQILGVSMVWLLPACNSSEGASPQGAEAVEHSGEQTDPAGDTAAPTPPAAAPAPAAVAPCIAGNWDAQEFMSKVKGSFRRAVGKSGLARASGTITFEFAPPDASGKGEVVARAVDLVFKVAVGGEGIKANGTVTVSGASTSPYTVSPAGELIIGQPRDGKVTARAVVRTSGIVKVNRTSTSRVDLDGEFLFECAGDTLTVWDRSRSGDKRGSGFKLVRVD